jgi:hypothetical protein
MNHNPSDNSANVPPSGQAVVNRASGGVGEASALAEASALEHRLNPALQQAFGCLDLKLEDELARFRVPPEHRAANPQSRLADLTTWERQSIDFEHDSDILTAEIIQSAQHRTSAPGNEDLPKSSGFVVLDGLTTSSKLSQPELVNQNYAPMAVYREDFERIGERTNLDYSTGGEITPFHDEYLSSSQELLRQIQSGYPAASDPFGSRTETAPPLPKPKYFTPLKIGSMAAACVLAGGVAYTALNPNILAPLTATKAVVPVATTNTLGQSIQSPNLATNEFTELNLSTLNNIKLPTAAAAPATNVSIAPTATASATTGTPVAIPFKGTTAQVFAPATITSQPRLADSLITSLLPSNFQSYAKPAGYRPIPSGVRR